MFQDSDRYVWSDGWYAPYRRWRDGASNSAPSGDGLRCVTMGTDGLWAPTNCDEERPSVCEFNFGKVFPSDGSRISRGGANPGGTLTYYLPQFFKYILKKNMGGGKSLVPPRSTTVFPDVPVV